MAGYAPGFQQYGNAGSAMRQIQNLNNFNQQFGGRNVLGAGQKPAQPRQGQAPILSNAWFGNMLGSAQRYLRGI